MATIKVCDRCGKHSPDKEGLHIANNWVEVVDKRSEYIWCRECFNEAKKTTKQGN